MGDEQPETFMVRLQRPDSGLSWGFRLQGGVDFNTPLSVQVVQPKSVADRCGLRAGDGIITINKTNTDGLTHEQAKMEIIRSCNDIDMVVMRGAVQIWRPKVTPMSDLMPTEKPQPIQTATGDQLYTVQKTSLARDQVDESSNIGSSYNRSAKPFGGARLQMQPQQPPQPQYGSAQPDYGQQYQQQAPESPKRAVPNVVHAQFNSPIGLYSASNIAKTYSSQTSAIQQEIENLDVNDAPLGTKMTGTYQRLDSNPNQSFGTQYGSPSSGGPSGFRSVTAPTAMSNPAPPPKQENMHCTGCTNLVTGVFVRIKGMPYHEKCFKCVRCGVFLKQKGYFMIEGQLYCEIHARQTAQSPGENMKYAGAVYR
ncbi:PDZ and LIM domain protein Zasp-like isoform X2 [Mya arenaria]|uniref:PDZ and LIM domain protein Zasp-like isoform X2 n=1 Tax=Mya arenaria TaxID=6604 RepID=UPI0022E09F23|nr:PDZ and LIM domain protein Zasp-like isoform X2 [Mya arenaria]XP_052782919.1 PDZ and LIM domain protein Zasp-like isoform X2 [Mya arenaria]